MKCRSDIFRLQVFALNQGRTDADLGENLDETNDHQGDGHYAKISLRNQACKKHDEDQLQQYLAHNVDRLPSNRGCKCRRLTSHTYLAMLTDRFSRMTVTFTWPGYVISFMMRWERSTES